MTAWTGPSRTHVALVKAALVRLILLGEKRIEARLSLTRRLPFGRVSPGDTVYFKIVGGPIAARARVEAVRTWSELTPRDVDRMRREFEPLVRGGRAFWHQRSKARHATLIWLEGAEALGGETGESGEERAGRGLELVRRRGCRNAWHLLGPSEPVRGT